MSRRGILSLTTILLLAAFLFAAPAQQSPTQPSSTKSNQTTSKQDQKTPDTTKSDKQNHATHDQMHDKAMQDTASSATLSSDDRKFIMNAAHGGMMEVKLGQMAADKATSTDVKQFGQRMVDDHSKANTELMALASQKGVALPGASDSAMMNQSDMPSSTAQASDQPSSTNVSGSVERHARVETSTGETLDDQKATNKLSGLSGDAFDREYIKMMVKDHEKDVKEFEKASTKAKDTDVRAFAAKTLPTLREHLQQVRDIQSRMKPSGNTSDKAATKP